MAETKVRPHGTRAKYVAERCRCADCRAANAEYRRASKRRAAHQQFGVNVTTYDATPVRRHVRALMDQGLGWRRIALLSGVGMGTVSKLLYGDTRRGSKPSKWIRPRTAQRLFAVTADQAADGARVDSTGTRRRLQALAAVGWTGAELSRRLGKDTRAIWDTLGRDHVAARTARAVRRLYDELWDVEPPQETPNQRRAVLLARRRAAENGWPPPMAWDDDEIDRREAS